MNDKELIKLCFAEMGDCGCCIYDGTDTCYLIRQALKQELQEDVITSD